MAALAAAIAILVAAPSASAADPVSGLLGAVTKAAAPAVAQVAPTVQKSAPAQAGAQQPQQPTDAAPGVPQVERVAAAATGPLSPASSGSPGTSSQHGQAESSSPATQPESSAHRSSGSHESSATSSHDPGGAAGTSGTSGSARPGAASSIPPHSLGALNPSSAHGAATQAVKQTTKALHLPPVEHPARPGAQRLASAKSPTASVAGLLRQTVDRLTRVPAALGEASRAIGELGVTAARLAGSTPLTIAPLLEPLQPLAPLLEPLAPLQSSPPPLALPLLPVLPIFTLAPQSRQPTGLALPPPTNTTAPGRPTAAPLLGQDAAPDSNAGGSSAPALTSTSSALGPVAAAASRRQTPAGPGPAGGLTGGSTGPSGPSVTTAGRDAYAGYASASGAAAPRWAPPARAPAPSPSGGAPASSAIAGTSIPIFLTLAGLLLLAAPRVRRVLRLLRESWRISPLVLIPERPG